MLAAGCLGLLASACGGRTIGDNPWSQDDGHGGSTGGISSGVAGAGGAGTGGAQPVVPACQPAELKLEGTIDGKVVQVHDKTSNAWLSDAAGDASTKLLVDTGPAGKLELELDEPLREKGTSVARGVVSLRAFGSALETCDGGANNEVTLEGGVLSFELRSLSRLHGCDRPMARVKGCFGLR